MTSCPRLIEVAFPIREVSAECSRDARLGFGHLSTLHPWWARRPLAACRAIIFASLVPDPDDPSCPSEFRDAVDRMLRARVPSGLKTYSRGRKHFADSDPYKPTPGIDDTLRNRLITFIAKWSPEATEFESGKSTKEPKPENLLDDRSLSRWETGDPENEQGHACLQIARDLIRVACGGRVPSVFDPFSGGGAIPLEAGRLGAQPIANDYSPVAHLVLRGTCEFAQRFGKPGTRVVEREVFGSTKREQVQTRVPNVLAHDVERWCSWMLARAAERLAPYYPPGPNGRPIVGYLWAREIACANTSCAASIPLLKSLLLCNRDGKRIALDMRLDSDRKTVAFAVVQDSQIGRTEGTMLDGGSVRCPFCNEITANRRVSEAGMSGAMTERMVAVIEMGTIHRLRTARGTSSSVAREEKTYRPVAASDLAAFDAASALHPERPSEAILPEITAGASGRSIANSSGIRVHNYGLTTWGSLFNPRQLLAMQTFVALCDEARSELAKEISDVEYRSAVSLFLALWVSRNSMRMTTAGRWYVSGEKFQPLFDGAKIGPKWDYPEANPLSPSAGGFALQTEYVVRFIERESSSGTPARVTRADAARVPLQDRECDVVVTDPPYFDEIAYADLSDFYYVWLKRTLGEVFPVVLATPQSPKEDEATALKHRHGGDAQRADEHFVHKLAQVLAESKRVVRDDGLFVVVFAHQDTRAWVALVNSLFAAGLSINSTWPIEMEMKNRMRGLNSAALATSIAVVCRPRVVGNAASFKDVRHEIEQVVHDAVKRFWSYGFRGADLIVACYGPAVGVFGKYERVERNDGEPVGVPELLELARKVARDAIAGEFRGDSLSALYYVWANLYGAGEQAWDDARLVVQIGGSTENALDVARESGVFVLDGSTCRLALLVDRVGRGTLGLENDCPLIDSLHRAMLLWKQEKRGELVAFLAGRGLLEDGPFWKLGQALFEVMPRDSDDWKLVNALLSERPTLRAEGKKAAAVPEAGLFGRTE